MRVLIVGGGKVGSYLAGQLEGTGHQVAVAESDPRRARELAENSGALVIEGDGTSIDVLRAADVDRSDWLIAVTGQDEVNLVACEIALTLGVRKTLARLNDPRNRPTFSALGIQVVAVTDLIGEVIEHELLAAKLDRLTLLGSGDLSVIEVEVPADLPDRLVRDLRLPSDTLLIGVLRGADTTVPGGSTVIRAGDRVIAVTTLDHEPGVRDVLFGVEP